MIASLTGTLVKKTPTSVIIDVAGVGYAVNISLSTYSTLPEIGSRLTMLTYQHVREDALLLFGFATEQEREVFTLLLSVSGIGPKMAQTILSGIQPDDLIRTIAQGQTASLTSVPGIGRKTAERLVVELREKVQKIESGPASSGTGAAAPSIRTEALAALASLGFTREKADAAIRTVLNASESKDLPLEELIKRALKSSGQ